MEGMGGGLAGLFHESVVLVARVGSGPAEGGYAGLDSLSLIRVDD